MKKLTTIAVLSFLFFCGCKNDDKTTATEERTETKSDDDEGEDAAAPNNNSTDDDAETPSTTGGSKAEYLSGVTITESGGLKVTRAFVNSVDGQVYRNEVIARANEKVILNLNMEGFKEEDGMSYVGAAEKITASDGTVILDVEDLFSKYSSTGLNANDARIIRMSAVVTGNAGTNPYYIVSFRVWDKKGSGEVKGNYKIVSK